MGIEIPTLHVCSVSSPWHWCQQSREGGEDAAQPLQTSFNSSTALQPRSADSRVADDSQ